MNLRIVFAILLTAFGLFGLPDMPSMSSSTPGVSVKEPSEAMKKVVSPVVRIVTKMNAIDRLWLQNIYQNASKVVSADGIVEPPVISTTAGLRAIHVAILKFIWKGMAGNPPGQYEGLSDAIESAMDEVIGDEHRQLTPELRSKAAELFDAIAWAGLGKDG
jgi:hypothetical protein